VAPRQIIYILEAKAVTRAEHSSGEHLLAQFPHFVVALASTIASLTAAARAASLADSLNVSRLEWTQH